MDSKTDSDGLKWECDIGLALYVATLRYKDIQQYKDSQLTLKRVFSYGLKDRINIIPLDKLDEMKTFFDLISDQTEPLRLPFLVSIHGCQTSAVLGYSGLDQVVEMLESDMFHEYRKNNYDLKHRLSFENQQY